MPNPTAHPAASSGPALGVPASVHLPAFAANDTAAESIDWDFVSPSHRVTDPAAGDDALAASASDLGPAAAASGQVTIDEILEAIADFSSASIELIAWEFNLDTHAIQSLWDDALDHGLLATGAYDELGERPCTLTAAGNDRLAARSDVQAA